MNLSSEERSGLIQLGRSLRTKSVLSIWQKAFKKSRKRYYGLCELVSTETDYLRDLGLIMQKIQIPLRECKAVSQEEQKKLFPNIQGMIDLSKQLLTDVTALRQGWNPNSTLLGSTMIRYSKFLQIYSQFFRSYERTRYYLQDLLEREQVKAIQAQLPGKSFQNLWSKPFQRPMKYKLLLSSYLKETNASHPDFSDLKRAIECYEEVNQRNNKALQHKQKEESLQALDARYGRIIDGDSKYYIDQVPATLLDTKVTCHILSNMLLIANADQPSESEIIRLYFDQNSFVETPKDLLFFKNRLYICGRRRSVHLCFTERQTRRRCERQVQGIINQLYKSEYTRKQLASTERGTVYIAETFEEARRSYTQLREVLPRPPRLHVVGQIRRRYGCIKSYKIYFIVQFILPRGKDNCQELYVQLEELLSIQANMRALYPQQLKEVPAIEQPSKVMSAPDMRINSVRSLEYKGINTTILLNFLFRHPQTVKRTDIIAHRLRVGETLWIYCRYGHIGCNCEHCREGLVLTGVDLYEREAAERLRNRQAVNTFLCPFRTVHAQSMLAQTDIALISTAADRLLFMRCERGKLDYRLLDSTPGSPLRKKVTVMVERVEGNRILQVMIDPHQRVGQILEACGRYHQLRVEDFELFLCVNKSTYILGRDQVLWQVLQNETAAGQNFFSFFKSAFGEKEDLTFRLYLRKLWVLQSVYEKADYQREEQVGFLIQQFMLRLRKGQIRLNLEDTSTLYACYFAYSRLGKEGSVRQEDLKGLMAHKRWKAMEVQQRAELLDIVRKKLDALRGKLTQGQIFKNIWSFIVSKGEACPGWSAYYFPATVQAHPQYEEGFQVRIGADLHKLYVVQAQKMTSVLQLGLAEAQAMLTFSSWELHITTVSFQYIFQGDSLYHLQQIVHTYLRYRHLATP